MLRDTLKGGGQSNLVLLSPAGLSRAHAACLTPKYSVLSFQIRSSPHSNSCDLLIRVYYLLCASYGEEGVYECLRDSGEIEKDEGGGSF
jgi:hypothetical protein